jgi:EAL domain-containing protein (putative c-di-GMP-specific phosphodiesterase class I)
MSLIKQLWLAIAVVMSMSLGGSLIVSTLSARHYLEQQLQVKNLDNATSLALSLSQMPKDPVTVELQVAAQFDAGHYRVIRLTSPTGEILVEREYAGVSNGAPEWFTRLIPITARPGIAQVQDGWHQYGTLTLESHKRYAYEALWAEMLQLLLWFGLGALATGGIGTFVIRHITRPLDRVVEQAEAIGGRRFVTTPEPGTPEFRSVVRAMNTLSGRVRTMLADESRRLEQLRRQTQHDEMTGLVNRPQFMNLLDSALARDDSDATGTFVIARLGDLSELNRQLGRYAVDRLLCGLAQQFAALTARYPNWEAGRMNGSDFALLAPGCDDANDVATRLARTLHEAIDALPSGRDVALAVAASGYAAGEQRAHLLDRVDGALAAAEQSGARATRVADATAATPYADQQTRRDALTRSLERDGVRLAHFPVLMPDGALLHHEAPVRLMLDGEWRPAGYFMPWAARLGLLPRFDAAVVQAALREIDATGAPLGINLSPDSLCDATFRGELFTLLQSHPDAAPKLWIEIPEYGAVRHLGEFRALCVALRPLGCKLGIEHAGSRFSHLSALHELGLDYIKIDAAMIRDIDKNPGNQAFLRGLCTVAHSIGVVAIAEGVGSNEEMSVLPGLGLDAMTGPAMSQSAAERSEISESPNPAPAIE